MPYTNGTLTAFMETELGPLTAELGLDESDALTEEAAEVALILDHAIADETDDLKLRTLARWRAWVAASNAATSQFDLGAGTVKLTRSQTFDHIATRLAQAEASALRYDEAAAVIAGAGTASVTTVSSIGNPYAWPSGDEFA